MNDKRLQLFGMYSMSILLMIAAFSLTIYFNINLSERRRVENHLETSVKNIKDTFSFDNTKKKTISDLEDYLKENDVIAIIWQSGESIIEINTQYYKKIKIPEKLNVLEKKAIYGLDPITQNNEMKHLYSYTTEMNFYGMTNDITVQVLYDNQDTTNMLENLTNILIIGSIIVSVIGILLGILLSYLNMLPVVQSWLQQRTFVADASHELRTPLSIITLKSDSLLKHSDEVIYEHIEDVAIIQQECRRMHKMVDNLLFLAKKDSGVVDLEFTDFRVQQLLDDLGALYNEFFEIEDKELILENTYKEHAYGDYEKIKQVCMIIIDNALRFTKEGGYVKIRTEVKSGRVNFYISNNGELLDPKEIPFIFERFYKGDPDRAKIDNNEGNGLGLSIAQEIIMLHQSKIKVEVDEKEQETIFHFSLQKK